MFLVDDILLAPVHGIFWIFREIRNAANQEYASESESITAELTELYMMLETGKITEGEFDARERVLLDRLDAIQLPLQPDTPAGRVCSLWADVRRPAGRPADRRPLLRRRRSAAGRPRLRESTPFPDAQGLI